MADTCWWCGREATILCDQVIGTERRKSDNTIITDESYACDAACCRGCAKRVGHACERGRGGKCDTIDACPEHAAKRPGLDDLATSKADADKIRNGIRARALRSRMRVVGGNRGVDG